MIFSIDLFTIQSKMFILSYNLTMMYQIAEMHRIEYVMHLCGDVSIN